MKKIVLILFAATLLYSCKSKTDWREKYREEKNKEVKTFNKNVDKTSTYAKLNSLDEIATLLDVSPKALKNKKLYDLILDWYATPYSLGNQSKKGIDCSGFTQVVYKEIYNKDLPRRSKDMGELIKRKYTKDLEEGDLVFFSFGGSEEINHVGIYLHNNKFVHASTKRGVIISDLTEPWYGDYLVKCGPLQ